VKKFHLLISTFLILLTFSSCSTTNFLVKEKITNPEVFSTEHLLPSKIIWKKIHEGIEETDFSIRKLGVTWHCIKIDLDTEGLSLIYEPHKENLGKIFKVKDVVKENNAFAAINSSPFDLGNTFYPVGITKYEGQIISPAEERYCALCFSKDEDNHFRAHIIDSQTKEALKDFPYAFGGFYTIFSEGKIRSFAKNKRSRVGAGLSDDGRILYLMVTTPKFHLTDRNGLNYEECALIFKELGCTSAMQFDGGHSSSLVVQGKDLEKPFLQRKVPTILGFKFNKD